MPDEKLFCRPEMDEEAQARERWTQIVESERQLAEARVAAALSSLEVSKLKSSDVLLALSAMESRNSVNPVHAEQ